MQKLCTFPGCKKVVLSRGLCPQHYQYNKRHGLLPNVPHDQLNQDKLKKQEYACAVCNTKILRSPSEIGASGNAFCSAKCWYSYNKTDVCTHEGCERTDIKGHGLCSMHYARMKRHGDQSVKLRAANGDPARSGSYPKMKVGGKSMSRHRYVAEQVLGRRLSPVEHVHHINGVKHDARPENLMWFPNGASHISYEKKRLHFLEKALQEGLLKWQCQEPRMEHDGVFLGSPA